MCLAHRVPTDHDAQNIETQKLSVLQSTYPIMDIRLYRKADQQSNTVAFSLYRGFGNFFAVSDFQYFFAWHRSSQYMLDLEFWGTGGAKHPLHIPKQTSSLRSILKFINFESLTG